MIQHKTYSERNFTISRGCATAVSLVSWSNLLVETSQPSHQLSGLEGIRKTHFCACEMKSIPARCTLALARQPSMKAEKLKKYPTLIIISPRLPEVRRQ